MRKKIQDMIKGKFDTGDAFLLMPEKDLHFPVIENETYEGFFLLESSNDEPIRGIITCPDPHMTVLTTEFDGVSARIQYSYHAAESLEGEDALGYFVIISSAGEYVLGYQAEVTKHYLESSIGRIKTLNDFTNLCKLNWEEALKVFSYQHFSDIFHGQFDNCNTLYEGITTYEKGSHEMEEFLVGAGKKTRNVMEIERLDRNFEVRRRPLTDMVTIRKSGWGNMDVTITSDSDFVHVSRSRLNIYDFVGMHTEVALQILPHYMHAGKNIAAVTFDNGIQQIVMTISAIQAGARRGKSLAFQRQVQLHDLEQVYLYYRTGELNRGEWKSASMNCLKKLKSLEPSNHLHTLTKAYILMECGDSQRALEELHDLPRSVRSQRNPVGAFCQYLYDKLDEGNQRRDISHRMREIQARYPKDKLIHFLILHTDDNLVHNPERAFAFIKEFCTEDCSSPIFYEEAARLVHNDPMLIKKLDSFEKRLLSWMFRRKFFDKELAGRLLEFGAGQKNFEPAFFRMLTRCYKMLPDDNSVKVICNYLIRCHCYGTAYFPWYRRGMKSHLKLAGLYEAFMLSWSRSDGELPTEIVKYFAMSNTLPTRRKAMLYAYVVRNKKRLGSDWDSYMDLVKEFALEELKKGRINEDLAIIYDELRKDLNSVDWENYTRTIDHSYRITTDLANVRRTFVSQKGEPIQKQVMTDGTGYVDLVSCPYVILSEIGHHKLYVSMNHHRLIKMLPGKPIYQNDMADQTDHDEEELSDIERSLYLTERLERFEDTLEDLAELIRQADEIGLPTTGYKEQLMIRALFTQQHLPILEDIFLEFMPEMEERQLTEAYLSLRCKEYLDDCSVLPEAMQQEILKAYQKGYRWNAYIQTAFLKYYAEHPDVSCKDFACMILMDYISKGIYFSFYHKLPVDVKRKYLLIGITVLEIRETPGESYSVWFKDGRREPMKEVLDGVYTLPVKLFPGETVEYDIIDRDSNMVVGHHLTCQGEAEELKETRYGKLSDVLADPSNKEIQYAYAQLEDLTSALFVPIRETEKTDDMEEAK